MVKRFSGGLLSTNKTKNSDICFTTNNLGVVNNSEVIRNNVMWPIVTKNTSTLIACTSDAAPYIFVYDWNTSTGFGTRYADPTVTPTGIGRSIAWSKKGDSILVGHTTAPYLTAYRWNAGFVSKYADPATNSGAPGYTVAISNDGDSIFFNSVSATTIGILGYKFNAETGIGGKYNQNGAYVSSSVTNKIVVSPNDDYIIVGTGNSSSMYEAHRWNKKTGFGIKYSTSANIGSGATGNSLSLSKDETYFYVGVSQSPFLATVPWDKNNGMGTPVNIAATGPGASITSMDLSPDNTSLVVTFTGNPKTYAYSVSNGTFLSRFSNPSIIPPGTGGLGCAFNKEGNAVAVGCNASPYVQVYAWSNSTGWGTKYSDPATLPNSLCRAIAFY